MATSVTLSGLKSSITALQREPNNPSLRQDYVDRLSRMHEEVFHKSTGLFKKDFYLRSAHDIADGGFTKYYGARQRLLPLAETVVKMERTFQETVVKGESSSAEVFSLFMLSYKDFSSQFYRELKEIYSFSPFFFQKSYPVTIKWFQSIVDELSQEKEGFAELFETSDPEALAMIFRVAIFRWIENPQGETPEVFEGVTEIKSIREQYLALSIEERERLLDVLLGDQEMDTTNPEYNLFIAIGKLKAILESNAVLTNSLLHTLTLY